MKYFIIFSALFLFSCNWSKQKAKDTANKAGEVVGKAGSEFADGVSKGVEKTFQNEVQLSDELAAKGLKHGKILILDSESASDNILSIYFVFDKNIDQSITVKLFDEANQEYGRATQSIKGTAGEAKYVDFVFHKRTNIDGKGKVTVE